MNTLTANPTTVNVHNIGSALDAAIARSQAQIERNSRLLAEIAVIPDEAWEIRLDLAAIDYPKWLATQETFPFWADTDHWRGFVLYERGYAYEHVPAEMREGWLAAAQAEAEASVNWAAEAEEEVIGADTLLPGWW